MYIFAFATLYKMKKNDLSCNLFRFRGVFINILQNIYSYE